MSKKLNRRFKTNITCSFSLVVKIGCFSCKYFYYYLLDLCEAANCHDNATCNMDDNSKTATCSCNYGFNGNGTYCYGRCMLILMTSRIITITTHEFRSYESKCIIFKMTKVESNVGKIKQA